MNLETFKGFAGKNGLVRMLITTRDLAPYPQKSQAGFPPEEALRLFQRKAALPVTPEGEPLLAEAEPAPAQHGVRSTSTTPTVEIPAEWRSLHHLQKVPLAKKIAGTAGSMTEAQADEIIAAEEQRRGAQSNG